VPNIPFQDGDQVFVQMWLKNANGAQGDAIELPVMANHIMDFTFVEQQGKTAKFSLKLFDQTFDALEDVIFAGGALNPNNKQSSTGIPVIAVKWGWVNGDRKVESPVWDMRVANYRSGFTFGQGAELELSGVAAPGAVFSRGNLAAGPQTDIKKLKTLVEKIAQKNGMLADVEDGTLIMDVRQNNKNDFVWLREVVNYAVKSDTGNAKYEVWTRNRGIGKSELVVRTQKTSDATQTWDYLYGVDRDGQVISYETNINSNILHSLGAGGFKTVLLDPKTKEFKEVITNSKNLPGVAGEGKYIPGDSNTPAPLRLGFRTKEAMEAYAAAKYLRLSSTNIQSMLTVHGNPLINPSDLVNVIVLRGSDSVDAVSDIHPTSGAYTIKSVTHTISEGEYRTELSLLRRGNLKKGAGGDERTTGSEAAINQVKRATNAINTSAAVRNARNYKRAVETGEDPKIVELFARKYRGESI